MGPNSRVALVVGGGIIGTTSAFRLARDGWRVTVFDPSPGSGATWAAAGMLAPSAEVTPGERRNYDLQRGALTEWRAIAEELKDVTGEQLEIVESGTLLVGFDASDRRLVDQFESVAKDFGVECERVHRDSRPDFFEGVTPRIRDGLFLGGDAWLDPDQAMRLLRGGAEELGVRTVFERVESAVSLDDSVEVTTTSGSYRGDVGLLATGSSSLPKGVGERVDHTVRPVRGMTIRVQGLDRSTKPVIRAFVRGRNFYAVSRAGGYCVLGASSDEQSELVVEVGELHRLLRDALDVMPSLEAAALVETRQGLRPATSDLSPFLEVVDNRWAWVSGHYRHGVTLAPVSAREVSHFAAEFL
ncbi:MAG: FAD-dependent oxidoreductase [Acidimicrobiales bacterium]